MVVLLSGGTGGAKLARGLLDVVGADALTVIANTGDDVEIHGMHVSPDPDLVTWWLADLIDDRGWGIRGDTFDTMAAVEARGEDAWFRLGDRDLELCRLRTELIAAGRTLTEAQAAVADAVGVRAAVLPMCDEPVRTHVRTGGRWIGFQEFMIVQRAGALIEGVELRGIERARPTAPVLEALGQADAIVIGPSNPVISIGPILAVPGMRDAIAAARAPVVAVSPFVGGRAVKGPTEPFCRHAGIETNARGVARAYKGLIDVLVSDDPAPGAGVAIHTIDTLMDTSQARRRVADETLRAAAAAGGRRGASR